MKLAAGTAEEYKQLLDAANAAATKFGIGTTESATSLNNLYKVMKPLGVEFDTIVTLFWCEQRCSCCWSRPDAVDGVMVQLIQAWQLAHCARKICALS